MSNKKLEKCTLIAKPKELNSLKKRKLRNITLNKKMWKYGIIKVEKGD